MEKKIPPLLLFVVFAGLIWLTASWPAPWPLWFSQLLAILLLLDGSIFCGWAFWQFRRANTTVDPRYPERSSQLVTHGLYQFSRNPMYLGFLLLLLALSFWSHSLSSFLWLPLFVFWLQYWQIMPEERALAERFGDSWQHYCQQTRRWL
ncbi:isoprenylcysteine carboxylmethyltransferase family protein [Alkalimonas delamerensis]|uniref:Isoprenylcysteine carboxylmethyltransferase family protein n=1 Tax=Alkalimonas delamerensis TaxID=265981 RepID=A0ABT9GTX2_9GAMM|nr:isoprenylcysteine carboxylmethyltransferase family protein [Alkalimonas delamerensis]MDP4530423.1 isoprenylcysteine carboxylmethyltransferase family protein [Alkalimonas delamerensis]